MVPSPPERRGIADPLPLETFSEGKFIDYLVQGLEPEVALGSGIRIVVNDDSSTTGILENDVTSVITSGPHGSVIEVRRIYDGGGLEFTFDTEFTIETFALYIDEQKVNLTFQ